MLPFLKIGTTAASFHNEGNFPVNKMRWEMSGNITQSDETSVLLLFTDVTNECRLKTLSESKQCKVSSQSTR
jgi:hypothetical protein